MTKELWINLPVRDLDRSKEFFSKLGFSFSPQHRAGDEGIGFVIGKNEVLVMLFVEPKFEGFTRRRIADTKQGSEVLFSIGAESREEVDDLTRRTREAGGTIFGEPSESQGWMYGAGFADLDGHRWNVLYMDPSRMPQE